MEIRISLYVINLFYTIFILSQLLYLILICAAWPERSRQILKKWRTLSPEQKSPFLLKARENRTNLRQKKAQQVSFIINDGFLLRQINYVKQHIITVYEIHGFIHPGSFYS